MEILTWQIVVISLYAFITELDNLTLRIGIYAPVQAGFFTGLVLGDPILGLAVGATLQLMILGIGTYGGASIPDFTTGAIIGTIAGVITGQDLEFAIGLAVPVGLLLVQLDILARFTNTFFLHRAEKHLEEYSFKKAERTILMGILPWGLSRMLPVLIVLIFGQGIINAIIKYLPDWLIDGLEVSGGLLPIVGVAILLRYLPTKKYLPYFIIGFALAAYLELPIVGVSVIGLAIALIIFRMRSENLTSAIKEGI